MYFSFWATTSRETENAKSNACNRHSPLTQRMFICFGWRAKMMLFLFDFAIILIDICFYSVSFTSSCCKNVLEFLIKNGRFSDTQFNSNNYYCFGAWNLFFAENVDLTASYTHTHTCSSLGNAFDTFHLEHKFKWIMTSEFENKAQSIRNSDRVRLKKMTSFHMNAWDLTECM